MTGLTLGCLHGWFSAMHSLALRPTGKILVPKPSVLPGAWSSPTGAGRSSPFKVHRKARCVKEASPSKIHV